MPMPTHRYLQITLFLLMLMRSSYCAAILFDPVEIFSNPGELLYAEIAFHYAQPSDQLEISLADRDDLQAAQLPLQADPYIHFHLRRQRDAHQGRIVITSTRPLYENELTLLLKIKVGSHTYLQPLHGALSPQQQQQQQQLQATSAPNQVFIDVEPQSAAAMPALATTTAQLPQAPPLLSRIEEEINAITQSNK